MTHHPLAGARRSDLDLALRFESLGLIEIVLDHPDAARPRAVTGRDDDRRLAVSFYGLSVAGG